MKCKSEQDRAHVLILCDLDVFPWQYLPLVFFWQMHKYLQTETGGFVKAYCIEFIEFLYCINHLQQAPNFFFRVEDSYSPYL